MTTLKLPSLRTHFLLFRTPLNRRHGQPCGSGCPPDRRFCFIIERQRGSKPFCLVAFNEPERCCIRELQRLKEMFHWDQQFSGSRVLGKNEPWDRMRYVAMSSEKVGRFPFAFFSSVILFLGIRLRRDGAQPATRLVLVVQGIDHNQLWRDFDK